MSDEERDLEAILEEYRGLIEVLSEQHKSLRQKLGDLTKPREGSDESSEGVSLPGPDLFQFIHALVEIQASFLGFWDTLLASRKALAEAAAENADLQSELARFSEQVMILSKAAVDSSEEKGRLSLELDSFKIKAGEGEQRIEDLCSQVATLENDSMGLDHELADHKTKYEEASAERDTFKNQVEELSAERDKNREALESAEETSRNLVEARRELEETQSKIGELESRLEEVRTEDENLRARVENFETENSSTRARVEGLLAEIEQLHATTVPAKDLEKTIGEREKAKAERGILRDESKSRAEKIRTLEKEIERRRTQSEETIAQKVDAEKSLQETEARLKRSEARVEELEVSIEESKSIAPEPAPAPDPQKPTVEDSTTAPEGEPPSDSLPESEAPLTPVDLETLGETEISMFQTDPDKVQSLALSEDRDILDSESVEETPVSLSDAEAPAETPDSDPTRSLEEVSAAKRDEGDSESIVDILDSSLGEMELPEAPLPPTGGVPKDDDSLFDEIFQDAFPDEPRESVEDFRAAVESKAPSAQPIAARFDPAPSPPEVEADTASGDTSAAPEFPYPEITGAGMERFSRKRVLLIGGDERFLSDYRHLFGLSSAELVYFPSYSHLERNGVKRHVRECDVVVVFGAAAEDPGIFRLKTIAEDYGRFLIEHPSSGLVSLYHELQTANAEL